MSSAGEMAGIDELNKRWQAVATQVVKAEMTFDGDFLVLGAQARLAKIGAPVDEARLAALLASAHGRSISPACVRHVRRALETWPSDRPFALTHLALSGLAKLMNSKEDARRLFLADAVIHAGIQPSALINELGLCTVTRGEAVDKYNPDQPRVPAGNRDGGLWTSGDWVSSEQPRRREGVEVADASASRGHEAASDAKPAPSGSPGAQSFEEAQNLDESCQAFIAANCQARIVRVFPGQYLACTLREVLEAAKAGDRAAQTACKLLFRKEYRK